MATYGLMFDNEYCTGCHSCEVACRNHLQLPMGQWGIKLLELGPWRKLDNSWEGKYVPVPTTSCDLCADRVEAGEKPACVLHCLAEAIEFGTLEELAAKMAERGAQCSVFLP
ncbi:MAG: oxidoreductase [Eggerthellaceae bacterium]|nr:oxidoreductase [Eggerthellaceae bacterium]